VRATQTAFVSGVRRYRLAFILIGKELEHMCRINGAPTNSHCRRRQVTDWARSTKRPTFGFNGARTFETRPKPSRLPGDLSTWRVGLGEARASRRTFRPNSVHYSMATRPGFHSMIAKHRNCAYCSSCERHPYTPAAAFACPPQSWKARYGILSRQSLRISGRLSYWSVSCYCFM